MPATAAAAVDRRLAALRALLQEQNLDAFLVTSEASIAYLSGFWGVQFERLFAVLVRADGPATLLAPELDRDGVAAAASESLEHVLWPADGNPMRVLSGLLGGVRRVAVEEEALSLARARRLEIGRELLPGSDLLGGLRARKGAEERAAIASSCAEIAAVYESLFDELRPGAIEREVNADVEYRLRRRGATGCHPLILFGEHAANSHATPDGRALRPGDVVCADVAAQFDGYWGDLTRCATAGPASDWARRAWEVVVDAHDTAVAAATVGASADDVDAAQRAIITSAPELGSCLHGAGHGLGMEVHEAPFLTAGSAAMLEDDMVVTIEPGIYQTGVGGLRLEDDVAISAEGPVVLSKQIPSTLRELPLGASRSRGSEAGR
jgi:Xaa-Pro dipeptidase